MTSSATTFRFLVLTLGLLAPLLATEGAHADATLACAAFLGGGHGASARDLEVVKTVELSYFRQRPYVRIPEGVALWLRAPQGMTAADLHGVLQRCQRESENQGSPLCVPGAAIDVERSGGQYVVRITSNSPANALEIQQRARS